MVNILMILDSEALPELPFKESDPGRGARQSLRAARPLQRGRPPLTPFGGFSPSLDGTGSRREPRGPAARG